MPAQWIRMSNESEYHEGQTVHFGRSFSRCDRPSNWSCVLNDDYCRDNETSDETDEDNVDDYKKDNITRLECCRKRDISSVTWYYLHLRGVNDVFDVDLEFHAEREHRPVPSSLDMVPVVDTSCDNVSLKIQLFGTVPFHTAEEEVMRMRWILSQSSDIRIDTFEISGKELLFCHLSI